ARHLPRRQPGPAPGATRSRGRRRRGGADARGAHAEWQPPGARGAHGRRARGSAGSPGARRSPRERGRPARPIRVRAGTGAGGHGGGDRLGDTCVSPGRREPLDSRSADAPAERLLKIRQTLVDRIWRGLFFVALVGAPASVSRSVTTGWLRLYSFHLAVALLVVVVYWYRARIPFAIKSALMLMIFWGIGLAGLFTLGFLGPAYWWLVMSSLLVSTLYSWRAGIATAAVATVLIAAAGVGFITGALKVSVDVNAYVVSASSWA